MQFYVIHGDFVKALHLSQSISTEAMHLDYEQFKFRKHDIDILLRPFEMILYRMHVREIINHDDIKMWRFHSRIFAKYLYIQILLRLHRLNEGYQSMQIFDSFINNMKYNDIDVEYVRTSKYLSMLNWNLFYACIFEF